MTRDEAIQQLESLSAEEPVEAHIIADHILLQFLASIGYQDIADAYREVKRRIEFYYS